jgi:hypothetical protein
MVRGVTKEGHSVGNVGGGGRLKLDGVLELEDGAEVLQIVSGWVGFDEEIIDPCDEE